MEYLPADKRQKSSNKFEIKLFLVLLLCRTQKIGKFESSSHLIPLLPPPLPPRGGSDGGRRLPWERNSLNSSKSTLHNNSQVVSQFSYCAINQTTTIIIVQSIKLLTSDLPLWSRSIFSRSALELTTPTPAGLDKPTNPTNEATNEPKMINA